MAIEKASALPAFITGIVCFMMIGFGWLADPLTAADQTGALSRLLAWICLAAAVIALMVAIYFTFRALTVGLGDDPVAVAISSDGKRTYVSDIRTAP
jgi:predicted Kef-type K+ transport protein